MFIDRASRRGARRAPRVTPRHPAYNGTSRRDRPPDPDRSSMRDAMTRIMNSPSIHERSTASSVSVSGPGDWRQRLAMLTEMMREMSLQDDPQAMVRSHGERVRRLWIGDPQRGSDAMQPGCIGDA